MSRRTIALLVLSACVLSLGGWLVIGPALATHAPVVAEPPIDLDAGMRAATRQDTAASPVRAIVQPASTAAGKAVDDRARCGLDQVPVYRMPEFDADDGLPVGGFVVGDDGLMRFVPEEIKPGGVGYMGAMRRVDALLRSSGDPYDRVVADALNVDDVRSPRERLATLVQQAMTSHDARVESMAFSACSQLPALEGTRPIPTGMICAALSVRQWAQDDPGNGVPWLYALQQADESGDQAAQREALRQLMSATRFSTRFGGPPAAVARVHLASGADLAAQAGLATRAVSLEGGPVYSALTSRCRNGASGNADMAVACDAIASRMMDHTDSGMTRAIGGSIHKQATGDASRLDAIRRENAAAGKFWADLADESPCSRARRMLQRYVQVGDRGEITSPRASAP